MNKRKIRTIRRSRSFKVIEVGTNLKPVCDFLLVINSNWHPISYRFGVIATYCSNFGHCVFEPPLGALRTTYDVHLKLIEKHFLPLSLTVVTQRNLVADFLQRSAILDGKRPFCVLSPQTALTMFDCSRGRCPDSGVLWWCVHSCAHLCCSFAIAISRPRWRRRVVPRARSTRFGCHSFRVCGPTVCNKLPQELRSTDTKARGLAIWVCALQEARLIDVDWRRTV